MLTIFPFDPLEHCAAIVAVVLSVGQRGAKIRFLVGVDGSAEGTTRWLHTEEGRDWQVIFRRLVHAASPSLNTAFLLPRRWSRICSSTRGVTPLSTCRA